MHLAQHIHFIFCKIIDFVRIKFCLRIGAFELSKLRRMQRLKNQQIAHDENLTPLKTSMNVHNFSGRTATVPDYMFSNYNLVVFDIQFSICRDIVGRTTKRNSSIYVIAFVFNINTTSG